MRATIRTQSKDERTEDAKTAVARLAINEDASYKVRLTHSEPDRPTRSAVSTITGTFLPGLLTALLKRLDDEIEQDKTGRITCWTTNPDTGAEDRHVFTAA